MTAERERESVNYARERRRVERKLTRVGDSLEFLLLLLVFLLGSLGGSVEPRDGLGNGLVESLLVGSLEVKKAGSKTG